MNATDLLLIAIGFCIGAAVSVAIHAGAACDGLFPCL